MPRLIMILGLALITIVMTSGYDNTPSCDSEQLVITKHPGAEYYWEGGSVYLRVSPQDINYLTPYD
jgi:hypothetical protein